MVVGQTRALGAGGHEKARAIGLADVIRAGVAVVAFAGWKWRREVVRAGRKNAPSDDDTHHEQDFRMRDELAKVAKPGCP